ncbi:MAG: hypothetical protein WCJ61_16755, partial [Paludibacter sp.]
MNLISKGKDLHKIAHKNTVNSISDKNNITFAIILNLQCMVETLIPEYIFETSWEVCNMVGG